MPTKKSHPLSRKTIKGKPPAKVQREQAAARRETVRAGKPPSETPLSPFIESFCVDYVRCGILEDAHRTAEVLTKTPLDTTGFNVEVETVERTVKGKTVYGKVLHITDEQGRAVSERELRQARAACLYHMPEVQARIKAIKQECSARIQITAESLAEELALYQRHAVQSGQLQVAVNAAAMKAKMFGIEAGSGEGALLPPAASVEINIRDFTGKPKPRED